MTTDATAVSDSPGPTSTTPVGLLSHYGGKRGRQAAVAWALFQTAKPVFKAVKKRTDERSRYTVKIQGTDDIYGDLHEWVLTLLPEKDRRAVIAATGYNQNRTRAIEYDSEGSTKRVIRLRFDSSRKHTVVLNGHKVKVEIERDETRNWDKIPENFQLLSQRIVFTASSLEGRNAVLGHVQGIINARAAEPGPPPLFISNRYGSSWQRRRDVPDRPLGSLILKDGQLDRIVADLGEFLSSEGDYNHRGIAWHRGYLLHGIPGTGKTTAARALANEFDLPVFYPPLGQIDSDGNLLTLVSEIDRPGMLVLEDVDVYQAATERQQGADKGVTLSALLNALDGIWTPRGLVTVMATNDRSALDDALIRPGRVDLEEEFTGVDRGQLVRLFQWFYADPLVDVVNSRAKAAVEPRSPAECIGVMSRHKKDPRAAWKELA